MLTHEVAYIDSGDGKMPIYPGLNEHGDWRHKSENADNRASPCECFQDILDNTDVDVLVYMHTDVVIHDEFWWPKIHSHLEKPDVVAVGLGGATSLGNKDLYRKKYAIGNMARGCYASNQDDAEVHGERFGGYRRVAVLDSFFMAINVKWLKSRGGWPTSHLTHHCLDLWLACEAARDKKLIYMEGCSCVHRGGAMSCGEAYAKAPWLQGGELNSDHAIPHKWLWDEYRDVLPIVV